MADVGVVLLPDSRARVTRGAVARKGMMWIPLFCASCCKDSGTLIPEASKDFAFYVCEPCAEAHPEALAGMYLEPDRVWFERLKQEQLATYGRELTPVEQQSELANPDSALSKLARDRPQF